jgi:tripartite ATP-independent transporter DctP family solute receptor
MKRFLHLAICFILCFTMLTACGQEAAKTETKTEAQTPSNAPAASSPASSSPASESQKDPWADIQPVKVKFAHAIADGDLSYWIIESWMKGVEEKSNGKITFDYYPTGQLGTLAELVEQIELGAIDLSITDSSMMQSYCPEIAILNYPFIMDSYEHAEKCITGKAKELIAKAVADKTNTQIIGFILNGARIVASTKPLNSLADCKGLVIRSPEAQIYIDTFTMMGMSPTPLSLSEVYTALQTGVVEAMDCPPQTIYASGYYQVAKNICKTRHMYSFLAMTANEKFWNGLPKEVQDLMVNTWDELQKEMNKKVVDAEDGFFKKFEEEGAKVTELSDRSSLLEPASQYWAKQSASLGQSATEIIAAIDSVR